MRLHDLKKLAAAMALAVAVTSLPAAPVSHAAAAPAFKLSRTSLYENSTAKGTYLYTVQNVKKGYTVKWSLGGPGADYAKLKYISTKTAKVTSSNKVTISTTGDMKAKNSKLSIYAKVYNPSGKLVKTITDDVVLKIQPTKITLKTSKIKEPLTGLSTGESYDFDKTFFPYNSTGTTAWSVTGSDGVDYSSQITSAGIWTPTKEGTYTITVYGRNSKNGKNICKDTLTATVGTSMSSIEQTAANQFKAYFNTDMSKKLTADSFTIKESGSLASVLPQKIAFSSDGKTVTVTTHTSLRDKASYTVSCGKSSRSFTASVGAVTRIAILTSSVPVNTPTPIEYALYDEHGIDVKMNARGTVEFSPNLTNGYLTGDDNTLFLTTVGQGGTITATYTDGAVKLSATRAITCREAEATKIKSTDFTITDSIVAPDFSAAGYKANTTISIGNTGYVHFRAVDSNNKTVNYDSVSYASTNENVLIIDEKDGSLIPIKEGKAVVIVKVFENGVESNYTFNINILAEQKFSSLGLSTPTVKMSNSYEPDYAKYVDVIPYDQYGKKMDLTNMHISVSNEALVTPDDLTGQLRVSPLGANPGTHVIDVTVTAGNISLTQKLYLTVVDVPYNSSAVSYKLELSAPSNSVDISMKNGDPAENKTLQVRLAEYRGGVFAYYVSFDSATISKGGKYYGKDLTLDGSSEKILLDEDAPTKGLKLTLADISSGSTVRKAAAGSYSIILKANDKQYAMTFSVTDKQNAPSVFVSSTVSPTQVKDALTLAKNCLTVPAGCTITSCTAAGTAKTGSDIAVAPRGKVHISTVTVESKISLKNADGTTLPVYVTHTVNVGQTLTNR